MAVVGVAVGSTVVAVGCCVFLCKIFAFSLLERRVFTRLWSSSSKSKSKPRTGNEGDTDKSEGQKGDPYAKRRFWWSRRNGGGSAQAGGIGGVDIIERKEDDIDSDIENARGVDDELYSVYDPSDVVLGGDTIIQSGSSPVEKIVGTAVQAIHADGSDMYQQYGASEEVAQHSGKNPLHASSLVAPVIHADGGDMYQQYGGSEEVAQHSGENPLQFSKKIFKPNPFR
jgi:hypothetical protein